MEYLSWVWEIPSGSGTRIKDVELHTRVKSIDSRGVEQQSMCLRIGMLKFI